MPGARRRVGGLERAENGESTIDGFLEGIPRHRRSRDHVIQWLESQLQERERLQLAFWDVVPDL